MLPVSVKLRACLFLLAAVATARADETSLRGLREAIESLPAPLPAEQSHGRIGFYGLKTEAAGIMIDLGREVAPDEIILFPARLPTGSATGDGSNGFPPALTVSISDEAPPEKAVRLARWSEEEPGSGNRLPFLRLAGNGASGRYLTVAIEAFRPRETGRGEFFTLGEIVVLEGGTNVALGRPVTATASTENAPRWQAGNLSDGFLWCLPFAGRAESPSNGYHSAIGTTLTNPPKWVEVDLGIDRRIDELQLVPAHPRDFADVGGFGFPPRFRVTGFSGDGGEVSFFDTGAALFPNPGAATVSFPGNATPIRRVRVEALELWQRTGDFIFALGELRILSGGRNAALGATVTFADTTTTGSWSPAALVDGFSSRHELLDWRDWLDALAERESLLSRHDRLAAVLLEEREARMRRWLVIAGVLVAIVAAGAFVMVAAVRRKSEREHEAWRARLAGDLHDEIGASLSHLALQSDLARRTIGSDDPLAKRLASLSASARETLDHLRDTVWLLDPACGSWSQLDSRLTAVVARLLEGLPHELERRGTPPAAPAPPGRSREIVLFLKEALTNVRRHAGNATARVLLAWEKDRLLLEIADTGRGFDPDSPEAGHGRGIANLRTRAAGLGGKCRIESTPGEGTTIRLEAPL
jgi:signal transduction histidine kinase